MDIQNQPRSQPGRTGAARRSEPRAFRHVLVCLDRSEAAEAVLPLASHIARTDRARMTLLHVLDVPPDVGEIHPIDALEWDVVRHDALLYLERLAERAAGLGINTDSRIAEGSTAHRIAALTGELEADLLVLSRGGGSISTWPVGGTARKILALSRGPVLVVPPKDREHTPQVPPRRILVPLDGSVRSECALPTAIRIARANNAEVILSHIILDPVRNEVLCDPADLALADQLADRLVSQAEAYLERLRARLAAAGVQAAVATCRATDHREALVALAARERADLVIPSAHGLTCNPSGRFGSVTAYLMAHSPVPVMAIQDLADAPGGTQIAQPSRLPWRATHAAPGAN